MLPVGVLLLRIILMLAFMCFDAHLLNVVYSSYRCGLCKANAAVI